MTGELDVYRSAHLLIKQHGPDAAIRAAMKADAFLEQGDVDGHSVWIRIKKAIEELQATARPAGQAKH